MVDNERFQISPPPPSSSSGRNAGVGQTQRLGRITASLRMNAKSHGRQWALDASYLPRRDNPVMLRPSRAEWQWRHFSMASTLGERLQRRPSDASVGRRRWGCGVRVRYQKTNGDLPCRHFAAISRRPRFPNKDLPCLERDVCTLRH